MVELKYSPLDQSWSVLFSKEDLLELSNLFNWKRKDIYLDYSLSIVEKYYSSYEIKWIEKETSKGIIRSPYHLEFDYRNSLVKDWGKVKINGRYKFPPELIEHKEEMLKLFNQEKRLKKGNNPAPRISKFSIDSNGLPIFDIEKAYYFDQVGTNLTLDYKLSKPILYNDKNCHTVREWDIVQAKRHGLPLLNESKLANTIGVSIGIYAISEKGNKVILKRKRGRHVAVYANMWHVPFSFALTNDFSLEKGEEKSLKDFINFDFGHEFAEEIGLDFSDFSPVKPLAFCRDLTRGGKPQFFLEMESKISFEELKSKIKDSTEEFVDKLSIVDSTNLINKNVPFSPELSAFILLKL